MGLFSGLEGSLERYIEGFFRDKFKGRVQPLEMAKRLAREMRDRKRISISRIYVPNEFTIYLHPEDYRAVSSIAPLMARELQDYLAQKAQEKNFTLVAPPRVEIQEDTAVPEGQMRIEGRFGDAAYMPGEEETGTAGNREGEFEDTLEYQPARYTAPVPVVSAGPRARLVVKAGPQVGKVFPLQPSTMVIGRRDTCDVVFSDSSVSRRHAQLEYRGGEYVITDLGSTNGVYVNGVRVNTKVLAPGDAIKMGATLCIFEVE
ncbi:FHA domain containing protein [Desulfofundulus kuznetsovii DSM 6115]|uniref:FHA domain containing protein n=1 Tax=Desulfofundulus kuznetsovii (strain DSM 6115 / VKM B-1805 / 17) TaxID=760568 RepID=A0AAU8PC13_DESK7|nr:FHA domain containing protein [Desulfofundulus kuznetsovii DSM 6115]